MSVITVLPSEMAVPTLPENTLSRINSLVPVPDKVRPLVVGPIIPVLRILRDNALLIVPNVAVELTED